MEKSCEEILRLLGFFPDANTSTVYRGSSQFFERKGRPVESPVARDLIEKALRPSDEPLYVLTIGCPVHVSSAILMEPTIKKKIVVIWLGGTTHYWPSASEFNLRQDVIASQVLFDSEVPLVQIPTKNVSEHLKTTASELEQLLRGRSRIGDFLYGQFLQYQSVRTKGRNRGFPYSKDISDISVIPWLNNPESIPSEIMPSPVLTNDMRWATSSG